MPYKKRRRLTKRKYERRDRDFERSITSDNEASTDDEENSTQRDSHLETQRLEHLAQRALHTQNAEAGGQGDMAAEIEEATLLAEVAEIEETQRVLDEVEQQPLVKVVMEVLRATSDNSQPSEAENHIDNAGKNTPFKCEPSDALADDIDNGTIPNFEFHQVKEEPDWDYPLENQAESGPWKIKTEPTDIYDEDYNNESNSDGSSSSLEDAPPSTQSHHQKPYMKAKPQPEDRGKIKSHSSVVEKFQCASCFTTFPTMVDLTNHIIGFCFKTLIPSRAPTQVHERPRKDNITLHCDQCSQIFRKRSNLIAHMIVHSGVRLHTCPDCGKSFRQASDLTKHMLVHTELREYKCRTCEKPCQTISSRNQHERFHTDVRNFKCGQCIRAFFTSGHLKRHMKVHNKKRLCFKIYHDDESAK